MSAQRIFATAVCNLDTALLQTVLPLLESEKVEAIEWSFDALFQHNTLPDWFTELLHEFAQHGRLVGHGVFFSLFSGRWSFAQSEWLRHLAVLSKQIPFDHVTEHFGFMTGEDFHKGAPLAVPFTKNTLRLGTDRLMRIQQAANCPVGLENLAFAYSLDEVQQHGAFLHELLQPVNGFIILDLHNFYCQLHNFQLDFETLIALYPLEMVREIHISGGSFDEQPTLFPPKIRRDTHDDSVPETVFSLLAKTLPLVPNLKFVVMEQLGTALHSLEQQAQYRNDFDRMSSIITKFNKKNKKINVFQSFLPKSLLILPENPYEDLVLAQQQQQLSDILENAPDWQAANTLLVQSDLKNSAWQVENWQPYMLQTALSIAQKWR
jgi:uncharacterized protein